MGAGTGSLPLALLAALTVGVGLSVLHGYACVSHPGVQVGMGVALWLLYGVLLQAWRVIIANAVRLALPASILGMRLRFGAPVLRPAVCPVRSDR